MECNEKISVIIPIYNVENYLSRCLETIIHQTYSNLEIILVNDGSTDKSLDICKDFQSKDSRIVLISQKNSGVTAARNTGLARATGDYIAWADPDDWADLDMFESVMKIIRRTRTELLICDCFLSYDDSEIVAHSVAPDNKESRASRDEAMQWLVKGNTGLWACFAARKLFDNFVFPTLHIAEDTYAYSYLIEKCSFVVFSPLRKYHYYQKRSDSLTHKKSCRTLLDSLFVDSYCLDNIRKHQPDLVPEMNSHAMRTLVYAYPRFCKANKKEKSTEYKKEMQNYVSVIEKNYRQAHTKGTKSFVIRSRLFLMSKHLYYFLFCLAGNSRN